MKFHYSRSAQLLERSRKVLAGGVSSEFRKYNYPHALFYTHGKGSLVYDADGNEYLDFTLSQGPLILGHSHPHVLRSVQDYSASGQLYAGQHIKEVELAEKLNAIIPSAAVQRRYKQRSGLQELKQAKQNSFALKATITAGWIMYVGVSPLLREMLWEAPRILKCFPGLPGYLRKHGMNLL